MPKLKNFSVSNTILRGFSGAFILNSGLGKRNLPPEAAEGLKQTASTGVPMFKDWDSERFGKFLAYSEIGIGAALLTPFVDRRIAGLALGTFSAGLLSMYFRTPGMTESDGIRPTQDGIPIAKDSWLLAIAGALITSKD